MRFIALKRILVSKRVPKIILRGGDLKAVSIIQSRKGLQQPQRGAEKRDTIAKRIKIPQKRVSNLFSKWLQGKSGTKLFQTLLRIEANPDNHLCMRSTS